METQDIITVSRAIAKIILPFIENEVHERTALIERNYKAMEEQLRIELENALDFRRFSYEKVREVFSAHTAHTLEYTGEIYTIRNLTDYINSKGIEELLSLRNFGRKAQMEVYAYYSKAEVITGGKIIDVKAKDPKRITRAQKTILSRYFADDRI